MEPRVRSVLDTRLRGYDDVWQSQAMHKLAAKYEPVVMRR